MSTPKKATTRKLKNIPGVNRISEEAFVRGQKFYRLLESLDYSIVDFVRDSKMSKVTLWMYFNGELDMALMRQVSVEKMLGALNVTDTWAWAYFEIPVDRRREWRTFRPPPLGHGEDPRDLFEVILGKPLQGEIIVPPGYVVTIDKGNTMLGLIIVEFGDRYLATQVEFAPAQGTVLGQLVRIDTGYRRDIPVPKSVQTVN
ncbi:hypothetical protein Q0M94_28435 (plasmid) [Deinococcus radiomollis]|uniref:hypothetical protein n=1 Tax=Deinococcus radiomollis TaxID=468916 RepID=UPI003891C3A5